jgi:hypothetical protein
MLLMRNQAFSIFRRIYEDDEEEMQASGALWIDDFSSTL